VGVYDALSGGNLLWWGPTTQVRTLATGDSLVVKAGRLSFSLA